MIHLSLRPRARIAAALVCGTLALAGCGDSTLPLPAEGAPDELEFSIGGFGTTSRVLRLEGATIAVRRVPWGWSPGEPVDSIRVTPTEEAWREFWSDADRAGVRLWQPRYRQENVVDGGGYGLRIVVDGDVIESSGSNAYPDRRGREHEGEMTDDFRGFLDALGELIGEPL